MANLFLRSPRSFEAIGLVGWNSARLTITINSVDVYNLVKNRISGAVYFEVSELIKDYLNITYDNPIDTSKQSLKVTITTTIFEGLDASGSTQSTSSNDFFCIDAYGYFEEGANPTTTRGYMQSNDIIYYLSQETLSIPVDRNNTTNIAFFENGIQNDTQTVTTSTTEAFEYITLQTGDADELRITTTDGIKIIKIIKIDECRFKPHKITFVNRWGGLQDLYFFKKSTENLGTTRETFKSSGVNSSGVYDVRGHQQKSFNVESKKKISLNSGFVSEDYNAPMQELLQSEKVWMEVDNVVTPMIVTDSSLKFKTSVNDKLIEYKLELDYAFDAINNIR
tara:strand:+ start:481 stop:1491 length:1011 start_codon:yes stop_codon:yes gene_type:complete